MDWLSKHRAIVDCGQKTIVLRFSDQSEVIIKGIRLGVMSNVISSMQAWRLMRKGCETFFVATLEPGPTRMASPNRNPEDARLFLLFSVLLNFLFQKCRHPKPWPDPNGGSKSEPGLLRRFHLSLQNILLCRFVAEAVSVLGKPIIIYNFNATR